MSDATSGTSSDRETWFGYPASDETISGNNARLVTVPADEWSDAHRRRLLRTQTIDGLVPTVTLRRTSDRILAYQLPAPGRSFTSALDERSVSGLDEIVSATEVAALAAHAGHLTGLVHGAIGTDDIHIDDNHVSISGMGLGWGGTPETDRHHFVAPEVLAGGEPSVRGDVYGLGRVLEAGLSRMQGPTPGDARNLIAEATSPDPAKRPASARAFAERLSQLGSRRRRAYELAPLGSSAAAAALGAAINGKDQSGIQGGSQGGNQEAARGVQPSTMPRPAVAGAAAAAGAGATGVAAGAASQRGSFSTSETESRSAEASTPTPAPVDEERKRRSGLWLVGGLVALAGLAGLGIWANSSGNDDSSDASAAVEEATTTEAEVTTTTEAETTTTTEAETTTTEAETTTTTEAEEVEETKDVADAPPPAALLSASDAEDSFEILHAVPGLEVDAYVDGQLAAPGFTAGTLAGPLPLTSAGLPLDLFVAQEDPPASVDDRNDEPVLAGPITIEGSGTLVAFVDGDGAVMLQPFANNLDPVPAGQGRLAVRHVAGMGPANITVDGETVGSDVPSGASIVLDVDAGPHSIVVTDGDGNELLNQEIDAAEGELTSAWIRGGGEEPLTTSLRRISGLQTAPSGIPSGNAGLGADSNRGDGLIPALAIMTGLSGLGLIIQRRRPAIV